MSSILLVHSILREELHIQKKKILSWIPKGEEREMGVWQSQKAVEKSAAPSPLHSAVYSVLALLH